MSKQTNKSKPTEDLDKLLSIRGKPFIDWKEERKYLREKWGMQGRQVDAASHEVKNQQKKDIKK